MGEASIDKKLVEQLTSRKAEVRQAAERELESLGDAAIEPLIDLLKHEVAARKRRIRVGFAWMGVLGAFLVTLQLIGVLSDVSSMAGIFCSFSGIMYASQLEKNAAGRLARFDDVRTLPALAQALEMQDEGVRRAAIGKLTTMLPRLTASDSGLLDSEQRACLYRSLSPRRTRRESAYQIALIQALEQIGDPKAVPAVERLAQVTPRRPEEQLVRDAAEEALPAIRDRAEAAREASLLLRPAEVAPDANLLLRPAAGTQTADPASLLRPVEVQPEDEHVLVVWPATSDLPAQTQTVSADQELPSV